MATCHFSLVDSYSAPLSTGHEIASQMCCLTVFTVSEAPCYHKFTAYLGSYLFFSSAKRQSYFLVSSSLAALISACLSLRRALTASLSFSATSFTFTSWLLKEATEVLRISMVCLSMFACLAAAAKLGIVLLLAEIKMDLLTGRDSGLTGREFMFSLHSYADQSALSVQVPASAYCYNYLFAYQSEKNLCILPLSISRFGSCVNSFITLPCIMPSIDVSEAFLQSVYQSVQMGRHRWRHSFINGAQIFNRVGVDCTIKC